MAAKNISQKGCSVEDCDRTHDSLGFCHLHYRRFRKDGHPGGNEIRNAAVTRELFWSRVDKTPGFGPGGDCWEWQRTLTCNKYGTVRFSGSQRLVHTVAWQLINGRKSTLHILHSCDNPPCCNPAHLREGTDKDNSDDKYKRNRQYAKLTREQVKEIRERLAIGERPVDLHKEYGVTDTQISWIRLNKVWKNI